MSLSEMLRTRSISCFEFGVWGGILEYLDCILYLESSISNPEFYDLKCSSEHVLCASCKCSKRCRFCRISDFGFYDQVYAISTEKINYLKNSHFLKYVIKIVKKTVYRLRKEFSIHVSCVISKLPENFFGIKWSKARITGIN